MAHFRLAPVKMRTMHPAIVVTLAMRKEDPDTLFFSRRLSMQGDTELGLLLKNTLDALELPSDTWRLLMPDRMFAILRKKIFSV